MGTKVKTIDITGDNYFGKWTNTRAACRAVIIEDGKMLLSYETKTRQWMLPSECLLEIDEYYEDCKWVNRYFLGTITGSCEQHLTDREKEVGMEPRWMPVTEIIEVFSKHNEYAESDEMRRGMYLREYTALIEILKKQ